MTNKLRRTPNAPTRSTGPLVSALSAAAVGLFLFVPAPLQEQANAQEFCAEGRVMGGCPTSIEEFPWQVSLFSVGGTNRRQAHFCGGTVIDPMWVLTAAHCIDDYVPTDPSPIAVYLGSTSLTGGGAVIDVETIYAHPDYLGVGSDDIALLRLASPANVPTVSLSSGGLSARIERLGTDAVVVGWGNAPGAFQITGTVGGKGPGARVETQDRFGTSSVLLAAQIPLVPIADCDEEDDGEVLCAGFQSQMTDACAGDSGGPLLVRDGAQYVQVGVVSGGTLCDEEGERFTTYTRVAAFSEWIRATMAGETEVAILNRVPDYSLDPTFFSEDITSGFTPDPLVYEIQAGGNLQASAAQKDCAGFVADAPDIRLTYEAGEFPLRIYVESDADTTLLINRPDGTWLCNDDREEGDLNPEILMRSPMAGQYDVWVGTYESLDALGEVPLASINVTEILE
ncbi:MAG: serine protease [Pseudomonadota bacterium]